MKEPITERIRIANLHLDLKNFRFEEQHSQKEAIETMIADQKGKLVVLAKDIFENGLSPTDLIIVVRMTEGKNQYKVLEGNRRVTCLKLIDYPNFIPGEYASIRRQFQSLANSKERASQLRRPLCAIFDNEEDAQIWIERKHSGEQDGKGTIPWNALQKSRFAAYHGGRGSLSLQIVTFLNNMSDLDNSVKSVVNNVTNTTNIDRLLADPYVREKLSIKVQNGVLRSYDTKERTLQKLIKLLVTVSHPEFTVNNIKFKTDRKIFIDEFCEHLDDKEPIFLGKGWNLSDPYTKSATDSQQAGGGLVSEPEPTRPAKPRYKLIPDDVNIAINDIRIGKVFKELSGMLPSTHPNAVAVLLRVFVELSVDCYIERNELTPDGNLTSSSSHVPLSRKIENCINHLKDNGVINNDLAKGILSDLNDRHSALSIDTMNGFVHNYHFSPKAESLRTGWDNIEPFMTILWQNMPSKK